MPRKLQGGCYILNRTSKLVHSLICHTWPRANIGHVCTYTDAEHVKHWPLARPCKFCMTLWDIRVMKMEDRIEHRKHWRIGQTYSQAGSHRR